MSLFLHLRYIERLKARNEHLTAALERRKAESEQMSLTLNRLEADCSALQMALRYWCTLNTPVTALQRPVRADPSLCFTAFYSLSDYY